jgi:hypothetical protein
VCFWKVGIAMLDREKLEAILRRRFSGATDQQVATAANAIMGLGEEWEEVVKRYYEPGYDGSSDCGNVCCLERDLGGGAEIRVLRRRAI